MHYFKHHIGDFRSGTIHMSRLVRWIYRDMIEVYYDTERPLPANVDEVCILVGAESPEECNAVHLILKRKFQLESDGYHHARCDQEIAEFHAKSTSAKRSAEAGVAARKAKKSEELALVEQADSSHDHTANERPPFDERSLTERAANQEPKTNNQEPDSVTPPAGGVVIGDAEDVSAIAPNRGHSSKTTPSCPHEEIVALYHEILPMCPRIRDWTKARQAKLRARWNETPERQNLDYWRRFFEYVAICDFLVGRTTAPGRKPFFATLHWMVEAENFAKIRERTYEQ